MSVKYFSYIIRPIEKRYIRITYQEEWRYLESIEAIGQHLAGVVLRISINIFGVEFDSETTLWGENVNFHFIYKTGSSARVAWIFDVVYSGLKWFRVSSFQQKSYLFTSRIHAESQVLQNEINNLFTGFPMLNVDEILWHVPKLIRSRRINSVSRVEELGESFMNKKMKWII